MPFFRRTKSIMATPAKKKRTDTSYSSPDVEMDPAVAKKLLVEGASLVILGVPPGTQFGIDMNSWNVGDQLWGSR